jgi:hypothetical protein
MRLDPTAVTWQYIDDELVAIDLATSEYLTVNAVAAVAWPFLEKGATLDELVDAVVARFGVDQDRARADMTAFVTSLLQRRLVTSG